MTTPWLPTEVPFCFLKEVFADLELQTFSSRALVLPALVVTSQQPPPAEDGKRVKEFLLS